MFACLPVDGLPCLGQTSELLHNFSCYFELKLFLICQVLFCGIVCQTQFFNSTLQRVAQFFLIRRVQLCGFFSSNSFLLLNSISESAQFFSESAQFCSDSSQLCSEPAQLCQRVLSFLHTYFVKSPVSGSFHFAYSVKSSVIFVLCLLFKDIICILYQESMLHCRLLTLYYSATLKYCMVK